MLIDIINNLLTSALLFLQPLDGQRSKVKIQENTKYNEYILQLD